MAKFAYAKARKFISANINILKVAFNMVIKTILLELSIVLILDCNNVLLVMRKHK